MGTGRECRWTRRRAIATILALAAASPGRSSGPPAPGATRADAPRRPRRRVRAQVLPPAVDLHADGALARGARMPVLLFFDRDDCPYCERALREYVVPLSREAPWRDLALFRQVEVDRDLKVVGFDGRASTHRALARRYDAKLTPTVLLVDGDGAPLGEPIVGLRTPDFYGAYLDAALADAIRRLR